MVGAAVAGGDVAGGNVAGGDVAGGDVVCGRVVPIVESLEESGRVVGVAAGGSATTGAGPEEITRSTFDPLGRLAPAAGRMRIRDQLPNGAAAGRPRDGFEPMVHPLLGADLPPVDHVVHRLVWRERRLAGHEQGRT